MIFRGHVAEEPQRELLTAYSLGALEDAEAAELRAHLDGCDECRGYLEWLQAAVDLLPASVEQLRPSPEVREAILAEVDADASAAALQDSHARRPTTTRSRWRGLLLRPATGFAAAALLVAAIAGYEIGKPDSPTRTTIQARAVGSADPRTVSASLDRVDGSGTLVVDHLPALPSRRVYEVWVQRDGTMKPESTFVLRRDGSQDAAVRDLNGADAVLVTQEPHGGSQTPTTRPLLRADLG
jgi:anti-sigma-K factor RskA